MSRLEDGLWTVPVRDEGRINSAKGFEPFVFITDDHRTMFVVSEIGTGFGGRDIYITKKNADGSWRQHESLGRTINTKFDEDAPFLTPDGNTLYFASNGHNSMGDYDIFKSVLQEDGSWGVPENLGPPINTPGHDRYFVTTDDGAIGYYASDRDGGYGETDIYRIILDCKAVSATIIRGVVFSEDKQAPVGAEISIFEARTGKFINTYIADSLDGKYEMRLKTERSYKFRIAADGYLAHSGEFTVPKQCDYFSLFQEIKIDNMEDSRGRVYAQRAYINNAFFNINQKMEEDFEDIAIDDLKEDEKDSLRSVVAANYNPMELTNFIQLIDILDPNGQRLSSEILGEKSVATIQVRDEIKSKFNQSIVKADQYFYNENIPQVEEVVEEIAEVVEQPIVEEIVEEPTVEQVVEQPIVEEIVEEPVVEEVVEQPVVEEVIEEPVVEEVAETPVVEKPVVETPKVEPVNTPEAEETIVFRNILFDFDKSDLRKASVQELNKVSSYLTNKTEVELRIDGHADWIGSEEYNMALSERRAKAAYDYLLDKGIADARLTYQFFGESNPIAPNTNPDGSDNPDGRQLNRRCEFKLDKSGTAENITLKF